MRVGDNLRQPKKENCQRNFPVFTEKKEDGGMTQRRDGEGEGRRGGGEGENLQCNTV